MPGKSSSPGDNEKKAARPPTNIQNVAQRTPSPAKKPFPLVGIGASAGGLEALELFLQNVPNNSHMAFVIVQHLDPVCKSLLAELLHRITAMPVVEVTERTRVEPDHVYVIPSNNDMSILHGVLHLHPITSPSGLRLPIDFFFQSLAEDCQERSVAVILSGMGSDGTLGLGAIKEKGGAVFVQSPESAKFDGMPRSAINAGLADVVARAEELAGRIIDHLKHLLIGHEPETAHDEIDRRNLEEIVTLLKARTRQDFSLYKKNTIYRRIQRRMRLHQIGRIADYVQYLRSNPHEVDLLFGELMIGVTSFFRDPLAWEQLKTHCIPALLKSKPDGGELRAWTVACSTGEEAYSLAIAFMEVLEQFKPANNWSLQIFATDLNKDAIDKARAGVYPPSIAADVSPERLQRFFRKHERGFQVRKEIRDMVIFATQNVCGDPPFSRLHILTCRNLLIYLTSESQRSLLPLFHHSLAPGGFLLLGSAETVGTCNDLFEFISETSKLYRKRDRASGARLMDIPFSFIHRTPRLSDSIGTPHDKRATTMKTVPDIQALTNNVLLQRYAPAGVLTNSEGDILYVSGHTRKYLEPAAGKANWNIFAMFREGLGQSLHLAFLNAMRDKTTTTAQGSVGTNGGKQMVKVTIEPLTEPPSMRGMALFVFEDVAARPARKKGGAAGDLANQFEMELRSARGELAAAREAMRFSNEELQAANEELQSANEELQSTNEELTTSKEEMQSLNEELQTVNGELQSKVDELSRTSNDMHNLLNSTDIATLFLDEALCVRRYTTSLTKIVRLIPGDIGRTITDIANDLNYSALVADVHNVLSTLAFKQTAISTTDGRWFNVRIMPYRTEDNRIAGVVITFSDITVSKKLEAVLREKSSTFNAVLDELAVPMLCVDRSMICTLMNREARRLFQYSADEVTGRHLSSFLPLAKGSPFDQELTRALREQTVSKIALRLSSASDAGWYAAHLYPNEGGIAMVFQRQSGKHEAADSQATTPNDPNE